MKKVLAIFGGVSILFIIGVVGIILYLDFDKSRYDDVIDTQVEKTIESFSELSMEQFNVYWGDSKPGTKEYREKLVSTIGKLGTYLSTDSIAEVNHKSRLLIGKSTTHEYIYDAFCNYTNGKAIVRVWLLGEKGSLGTNNITFTSDLLACE